MVVADHHVGHLARLHTQCSQGLEDQRGTSDHARIHDDEGVAVSHEHNARCDTLVVGIAGMQDGQFGGHDRQCSYAACALLMIRPMFSGSKNSTGETVPAVRLTKASIASWLPCTAPSSCCISMGGA